jgi:hypothetical protein
MSGKIEAENRVAILFSAAPPDVLPSGGDFCVLTVSPPKAPDPFCCAIHIAAAYFRTASLQGSQRFQHHPPNLFPFFGASPDLQHNADLLTFCLQR